MGRMLQKCQVVAGAERVPVPHMHVHIHLHTYITQVLQEYRKMGWCCKSTNTITTHTRTHTSTYIHHTGAARVSQNGLVLEEYQYHYHTYTHTYIYYIHTSHRCCKRITKWIGAGKVPIPLPHIHVHIHLHTYITQVLQEYHKMGWCWKSTKTITTHTRTRTPTHHTGAARVSQNGLVLEEYQDHYYTYTYTYIYIHTSHRCCKRITRMPSQTMPQPQQHVFFLYPLRDTNCGQPRFQWQWQCIRIKTTAADISLENR